MNLHYTCTLIHIKQEQTLSIIYEYMDVYTYTICLLLLLQPFTKTITQNNR